MSRRAAHERDETFFVRLIFWLPFKKRFSREEYAELFRIHRIETRMLLKRKTYILGVLLSVGLGGYFIMTSTVGDSTNWSRLGLGALVCFGYLCGINSVREHLCERLLRLKQHPEELDQI